MSPIRLAFDFVGIRPAYEKAIRLLVAEGFNEFTNYRLFNFADSPRDRCDRFWANAKLNKELGVRITGFPMRFIPMDDVSRRHVAPGWKWRYLRGIQCVLLATRGLGAAVSTMVSLALADTDGDRGRVAAQIVTGVGFLGAGVILRGKTGVQGMTTAATIWAMAAVGMVVGAGYGAAGLALSVAILGMLTGAAALERRYLGPCRFATGEMVFDPDGGKTAVRIDDILDE